MDISEEEFAEVYQRVSAKVDVKSDEFEDEMELQLQAFVCMKTLRNDVRSWLVQPSEEKLHALATLRATVELTEERAAFFTILARKDNTDEEMAGIKQLEAQLWQDYLLFSEYLREFEKCFSVGDPLPKFPPEFEEA
jgi:hypothetical protein